MVNIFIGILIGAALGAFAACLFTARKRADRKAEVEYLRLRLWELERQSN